MLLSLSSKAHQLSPKVGVNSLMVELTRRQWLWVLVKFSHKVGCSDLLDGLIFITEFECVTKTIETIQQCIIVRISIVLFILEAGIQG